MGTWEIAHGADVNKRMMGTGYGCQLEDGPGGNDIICQPSTTPAPTDQCGAMKIVNQSSTCDSGYMPANTHLVGLCAQTICGLMFPWESARGSDENSRLMGYNYGCKVQSGESDANNTVCVPIPSPSSKEGQL
eukprot:TRINITY_DN11762_c0_g1_i1.p1 TRINITY_DN11762_c0_g1~~TRINITY_DN11762_c0_g1_i1.p1  ORF type:complete len:133 (+),score=15.82 TRINITY_DN11762_c0_g1_i1:439-837(+)